MQDKSAVALALELIKRIRRPSLKNTYWMMRIALLLFGLFIWGYFGEILALGRDVMGFATETVEKQAKEITTAVTDEIAEVKEQQEKMNTTLSNLEKNQTKKIIKAINANQQAQTGQRSTGESQTIEPEESAKPFKIMPSAPLSESDIFITEQDKSIESQEFKRSTIQPSSQ